MPSLGAGRLAKSIPGTGSAMKCSLALRTMETAARATARRLILLHQCLILQRHPRREQLRAALSELLFHLRVRRSQYFARDGGGGHDRLHQMADVGKVLDRGIGVAVALEDHRLALILYFLDASYGR